MRFGGTQLRPHNDVQLRGYQKFQHNSVKRPTSCSRALGSVRQRGSERGAAALGLQSQSLAAPSERVVQGLRVPVRLSVRARSSPLGAVYSSRAPQHRSRRLGGCMAARPDRAEARESQRRPPGTDSRQQPAGPPRLHSGALKRPDKRVKRNRAIRCRRGNYY